jgi:Leucine-rich repeat (LRR) protein
MEGNDLREKLRNLGLSTAGKKEELIARYLHGITNGHATDDEGFERKRPLYDGMRPNGRPKKKIKKSKKKKDPFLSADNLDGSLASSDEAALDYMPQPIFDRPRKLYIRILPEPQTTLELNPEQLKYFQSSTSYHYFHTDPFEHVAQILKNDVEDTEDDEDSEELIKDRTLNKVICEHLKIEKISNEKELQSLRLIQSEEPEEDVQQREEDEPKNKGPRRKRRGRPRKSQVTSSSANNSTNNKSQIESLSGIEHCISLERIIITSHRVHNIQPLTLLPHLQEIWLMRNRISELPSSMESLVASCCVVNLSFNAIQDITPLAQLKLLTYLNLSYNQRIVDISPLALLPRLEELDLSGNSIDDKQLEHFPQFESRTTLHTLKLNLNKISVLNNFELFVNLKELSLNCNQIRDVIPLLALKRLREADLQDNAPLIASLRAEKGVSPDAAFEAGQANIEAIQKLRSDHVRIVV